MLMARSTVVILNCICFYENIRLKTKYQSTTLQMFIHKQTIKIVNVYLMSIMKMNLSVYLIQLLTIEVLVFPYQE